MIRDTHKAHPAGHGGGLLRQRRRDRGRDDPRFYPAPTAATRYKRELTHILMKVETHNHPTAISPFPARPPAPAARSATRAPPAAAPSPRPASAASRSPTCAFPATCSPGNRNTARPERIASALDIMIEGPIGAAAFNNEFGRPNLAGYFRTFEQDVQRRDARLPQADHDRRRPRQHRRRARPSRSSFPAGTC
jgi:phosphoribosylformylglycinamidine synthase